MVDAAWLAHLIDKVHPSTDGVAWNSYKENNVEKVTAGVVVWPLLLY